MTIRGILFDKDGTLLDYHATWLPVNRRIAMFAAADDTKCADELMELGGFDPATGRVRSGSHFAAASNAEIADLFAHHLGDRQPPQLHKNVDRISVEGGQQSVAVDGCKNTLQQLRGSGLELGIATNDSAESLRASLQPHDILDLFCFQAGYDSGFGAKPDPSVIYAFCSQSGLKPSEVAMVGDNEHDLLTGKNAAAALNVGVLTGTSQRQDLSPLADIVLDSIANLPGNPALL